LELNPQRFTPGVAARGWALAGQGVLMKEAVSVETNLQSAI
jgi:hypothetical protein